VSLNPSFLLWLVRVYFALIGQMAQSVVISLLCSDWSDPPVCCDWSTLLWLVRSDVSVCCDWSTLLWLVRPSSLLWFVNSALIGQTPQSVVIGLLCSDWSDPPVCCDWSTLLWLVRCLSLLWLVNSALIGQTPQSVVIGLLCSDWSLRAGKNRHCSWVLCNIFS